ncbi:MAG: hypothetical protein V4537_11575 [Pseudomonadota bacterium]
MMIAAMFLLVAQVQVEPPPDDIVVATKRLSRLRVVMRKDRATGEMRCVFKRRSGDAALDQGVCDAMVVCTPKVKREADIRPCMEPAIRALLPKAEWTARRAR